jgi:hypothetical protein
LIVISVRTRCTRDVFASFRRLADFVQMAGCLPEVRRAILLRAAHRDGQREQQDSLHMQEPSDLQSRRTSENPPFALSGDGSSGYFQDA